MNNTMHKISLYADDIVLDFQDLPKSHVTFINEFSELSNYPINWSKTTTLPLKGN